MKISIYFFIGVLFICGCTRVCEPMNKECPDGSRVGLDINKNCAEFELCPDTVTFQDILSKSSTKPEYTVHHTYSYSSSSGDRVYDITYSIKNEGFISCEGYFEHSGRTVDRTDCSLEELTNNSLFRIEKTMTDMLEEINTLNDTIAVKEVIGEKTCFGNLAGGVFRENQVCFDADNFLADYNGRGSYGGGRFSWSVE